MRRVVAGVVLFVPQRFARKSEQGSQEIRSKNRRGPPRRRHWGSHIQSGGLAAGGAQDKLFVILSGGPNLIGLEG
jgi:hypothetical protein